MNTFKFTANLVADPELKFGNSGKAYVRLRVAESRGEGKESNFYDVTAFESLAENVADSLHKGDRVVIDGYFDAARTYQTGAGETRIALDVIANEVTPSLRFAAVEVTRNDKRDGAASSTYIAYDEPEEDF
jgi:single-strand DNA-binding protein